MSLLLMLAALAVAASLFYACYRRPDVALALLLAGEVFFIAFGPNAAVIGGLHLTPTDAVAFALLGAGAFRSLRAFRTLNLNRVTILCYLALFAFSVLRGLIDHGLTSAGNESRTFVGPLAGMLYFTTVPTDEASIARYTRIYLWFGLVLCGVAVGSMAGLPIGMMSWTTGDLRFINGRYLPSTGGAALAVCGILSLAILQYRERGWMMRVAPVLFLGGAIYLRHRTVWAMLLVGMAALIPLDFKMFRRVIPFAAVAVLAVALGAAYSASRQGQNAEAQFADAASNGGTFIWRLNGWVQLLFDDEQTALTVATGKSMGGGYWRVDPDSYEAVNVAPHSEYVEQYLRVGVLGTMMLLLFAGRPVWRLWRRTQTEKMSAYPSTSAWAIVVLIMLVYGFTYGLNPHSYALIGIANAMAMNPREETEEVDEVAENWELGEVQNTVGEGI